MSVKVTDNTGQVVLNISQRANIFLRSFGDKVVAEARPITPKKSGRLRMDIIKTVQGLKSQIIWGKKYAAIQEERQFRNYTTPGTGPHFAEKSIKRVFERTQEIARSVGLISR